MFTHNAIPAKIDMKKFTKGPIIIQRIETFVNTPIKIRPNKTCGPYCCIFITNSGLRRIIIPENICDPSKGGMGNMLKTANAVLICAK